MRGLLLAALCLQTGAWGLWAMRRVALSGLACTRSVCAWGPRLALREMCSSSAAVDDAFCTSIEESVLKELQKLKILPSSILLSVSGGSDSIAMMHIMQRIKERYWPQLNLNVINFNHLMRPEAEEEAEFVKNLGQYYGMDTILETLPSEVVQKASGFQDASRTYRRDASVRHLSTLSPDGLGFVCLAHTLDDQLETILLKLLRGVHVSNIGGMDTLSGPFLRPLLHLSKQQLTDYLTKRGLQWREDASNKERKYRRNIVRLDLLPLMQELAGGREAFARRMLGLTEQSQQMRQVLTHAKAEMLKEVAFARHPFYHALVYPEAFALAPATVVCDILNDWIVGATGVHLSSVKLTAIFTAMQSQRHGRQLCIQAPGWDVHLVGTELRLQGRHKPLVSPPTTTTMTLAEGESLQVRVVHPSHIRVASPLSVEKEGGETRPLRRFVVPLHIADELRAQRSLAMELRYSLPQDEFQDSGAIAAAPLKGFLKQLGVPLHARSRVLVVASVSDENSSDPSRVLAVLVSESDVRWSASWSSAGGAPASTQFVVEEFAAGDGSRQQ